MDQPGTLYRAVTGVEHLATTTTVTAPMLPCVVSVPVGQVSVLSGHGYMEHQPRCDSSDIEITIISVYSFAL